MSEKARLLIDYLRLLMEIYNSDYDLDEDRIERVMDEIEDKLIGTTEHIEVFTVGERNTSHV